MDLILDGGPTTVGIESTVVSLHRNPPVVLRPGMITKEQVERVTGSALRERNEFARKLSNRRARILDTTLPGRAFCFSSEDLKPPRAGAGFSCFRKILKSSRQLFTPNFIRRIAKDGTGSRLNDRADTPEWAGILDRLQRATFDRNFRRRNGA